MSKGSENSVSLDSFLDILTCLQGVLMLIIITTGIDAAQTKILVATPMEMVGDERPIYIECRRNELFLIPIAEARKAVSSKVKELSDLRRKNSSDIATVLEAVGEADVDIGGYVLDFSRYMSGKIALWPKVDDKGVALIAGHTIDAPEDESESTWFGKIIANMDIENERIVFKVRDDSFDVFKFARVYAWTRKAKVTYELLSSGEPLIF